MGKYDVKDRLIYIWSASKNNRHDVTHGIDIAYLYDIVPAMCEANDSDFEALTPEIVDKYITHKKNLYYATDGDCDFDSFNWYVE